MSDETSINGGADLGTPEAALGPEEGAAIMREQEERAEQAFRISHRGSFVVWGAVTLLGYGWTWLAVHSAHPAEGPNPAGVAVVSVLALGSGLAAGAGARADVGVGGVSARRRRIHLLALVVGLVAMYTLEGALYRAGAGRPVLFVFEATA